MSSLTEEQLKRIEAKRQEALQRKKEREKDRALQQQQHQQYSASQQPITGVLNADGSKHPPVGTSDRRNLPIKNNNIQKTKSHINNDNKAFQKSILNADFVLFSRERFLVNITFDAQVIDIFKSIQSKSYDPKTRQWSFHIRDHDRLLYELQMLKKVNVNGIPEKLLKALLENQEDENRNIDLSRIDPELLQSLMPFQEEGVRFGISKGGRCLLADDMGLGKTIQALGIAHYYKDDWPLLIVAPSSVRYIWLEAIQKWLPSVPLHEVVVITASKETDQMQDANVVITSYNLMSRCENLLSKRGFSVFIMDESHYLKSNGSHRSQAAVKLLKKAKRVIMLSGTPALSRPQELFVQLSILRPKLFTSMMNFGVRYCAARNTPYGWDFSGSSNMTELKVLLESNVMLRRIKSDVISQLPSKIRQMVVLDPHLVQTKNNDMVKSMKKLTEENLKGLEQRGALLEYYFSTARAKLKAIREYIAELLDKGKKFICFAHHKIVLDEICKVIIGKGVDYIRIDGKVDSINRKKLCDKFQLDENCAVAVLSITAASFGITLTAAYLVVFAELYWNPGILMQAEDRAHRIGQTDSVLVQYLVAKDTADDHLWPLIQGKFNVLNKAGLSKEDCLQTQSTAVQSKSQGSTILKYFEEISDLGCDEENELLANIDLEEVLPKKAKLNE